MDDLKRRTTVLSAVLLGSFALGSAAEGQPRIDHDEVGCISREEFTRLLADIEPPGEIRAAKLYFRSTLYPEFYFVEMKADPGEDFQAVLPLPSEETNRIVYYIEAIDVSFQTSRSQDFEISVPSEGSCRPGPGALLFGGDPGIIVGAIRAGLPALPPGFQAIGITGFLAASGTAAGGGIGGAAVAIGAAAGAAAGAAVVVSGGEEPGSTTSVPASSGGSSSTTATASGPAPSSTTTTVTGAPPSTTTTTVGSVPPTTTTTTGPTVPPPTSTTTSTEPPGSALSACFEWEPAGSCKVHFESCSTPENAIDRYDWRMLGSPVPEPPQVKSFTFDFAADPRCGNPRAFNRPVRLTVFDDEGNSDTIQHNVSIVPGPSYRLDSDAALEIEIVNRLEAAPPDGRVRGRILVNGAPLQPIDNGSPVRSRIRAARGAIVVEGTLLDAAPPGSLWEMDLSSSPSIVPGSLRALAGSVVSAGGRRVVFRLAGQPGEIVRFRLEAR